MYDKYPVRLLRYWPSHTGGYSSEDYARNTVYKWACMLKENGISCLSITDKATILHPIGSGSGGAVRCGDDWVPSLFEIFVASQDLKRAQELILNDSPVIGASCLCMRILETVYMKEYKL